MAKIYHCYKCERDIIAPSITEVLKKVQLHDKLKHGMPEYSLTRLQAVRRRIESYMDS
jgi:predicted small metal-binding protein